MLVVDRLHVAADHGDLILPLGKENGKLRIAVHDPLDFEMLEVLRTDFARIPELTR